jgi:hypothetical protein
VDVKRDVRDGRAGWTTGGVGPGSKPERTRHKVARGSRNIFPKRRRAGNPAVLRSTARSQLCCDRGRGGVFCLLWGEPGRLDEGVGSALVRLVRLFDWFGLRRRGSATVRLLGFIRLVWLVRVRLVRLASAWFGFGSALVSAGRASFSLGSATVRLVGLGSAWFGSGVRSISGEAVCRTRDGSRGEARRLIGPRNRRRAFSKDGPNELLK